MLVSRAALVPLPPPVERLQISLLEAAPPPPAATLAAPPAAPPEKPVKRARKKPPPPPGTGRSAPEQALPEPPRTAQGETGFEMPQDKALEARHNLLAALVAAIEREKRYPMAALRLRLEGVVDMVVHIDGQGAIREVGVKNARAHPTLEKAALEALRRVQAKWSPLPAPESMSIDIPIRYTIENS
jgi:protein TonB